MRTMDEKDILLNTIEGLNTSIASCLLQIKINPNR